MYKKVISKKMKLICGSLSATALLIPIIAVSAIACSPEIKPTDKNKIILNTRPVNGTLFLNQDENLPVLSVEAKVDNPNAQLTYQWYESNTNSTTNGKPIPGATQSTYTIPKSYTQKAGTKYFYAVISTIVENNIINSVISSISTVKISGQLPPIRITSQPTMTQNIIIKQSENLPVLSVGATTNNSEEKLTYQWYSSTTNSNANGVMIDGATNSSYTIPENDVTEIGSKYYYVKISGSINGSKLTSINSNVATINVNLPEIIINQQPVDKTTTPWINNLPTFSVVAESLKGVALTYQWYSNTTNSNTGGTPINGATKATYEVPRSELTPGSIKHYYVQISGAFHGFSLQSINSNAVNLNVDSLPVISIQSQPLNQNAIVETPNLPIFSVGVNNIDGVKYSYQWYWSTPNPKDPWYLIDGATSSSYKVKPSDVASSGATKHYYVRVNGSINGVPLVGINSSVVSLNVNPLPKIIIQTQPVDKTAILGTANLPTFSVAVNDIEGAQFKYQWHSNESNSTQGATKIPNATESEYTIPQSGVGSVGSKYFFVQISGSIDGVKLTAINSNVVNLNVNAFPTITISANPQNLDATVNQTTNLPTFSVGVNNIEGVQFKYQWYENGNNSTNGWTAIPGATKSTYSTNPNDVKKSGKKYYYVKISGTFDGRQLTPVISEIASLTISDLPIISINKQPTNQTAILGSTNLPTFSVGVNPIQDAQLNYQWFWSNPKGSWNQIDGANGPYYKVNASEVSTPGNTTRYYVKISGSVHGVKLQPVNSNPAILNVSTLPEIKINKQPQKNKTYYLNKQDKQHQAFRLMSILFKMQNLLTNGLFLQKRLMK